MSVPLPELNLATSSSASSGFFGNRSIGGGDVVIHQADYTKVGLVALGVSVLVVGAAYLFKGKT